MICSLKTYKGIFEYIECARRLPEIEFELVLNATQDDLSVFFSNLGLPKNLKIFPRQRNVHEFFQRSKLVVNFSLSDQWVETFGMTILEAMSYGRPVIVPKVGGITELVIDQVNGYHLDSRATGEIATLISRLAGSFELYQSLSAQAYARSLCFTAEKFELEILAEFELVFRGAQYDDDQLRISRRRQSNRP